MEKGQEEQNPTDEKAPETASAMVDPRNKVYSTRDLGLRVFASRCSVLFDSYLRLLNTWDRQRIARAVFAMEGSYEEIVALEKYLIEQHLGRPIREMDSSRLTLPAPEPIDGFGIWKCNGHIIYIPNGFKIAKNETETTDSKSVTQFLPTPGTVPTCSIANKMVTDTRNIFDASEMLMKKLNNMLNKNENGSCSTDERMKAKCESLIRAKCQEDLHTIQNALMAVLKKVDIIDFYHEGGKPSTTSDFWLPHTSADALDEYLQNVQDMHSQPQKPEVRQRLMIYNELVAPTFPPNPVASMDSSYGSTPDVSLPFQEYADPNVVWQFQERPVSQFAHLSSPLFHSGTPKSRAVVEYLKPYGDEVKNTEDSDDEEKEESEQEEQQQRESMVVHTGTMKVANWLHMSEPHISQQPQGSQNKKSRNARRKRRANKRSQQANLPAAGNKPSTSSLPSTSK